VEATVEATVEAAVAARVAAVAAVEATACATCGSTEDAPGSNDILLCDACDAGYHMRCLQPPLEAVPEGDWFCPRCARDVAWRAGAARRAAHRRADGRAAEGAGAAAPAGPEPDQEGARRQARIAAREARREAMGSSGEEGSGSEVVEVVEDSEESGEEEESGSDGEWKAGAARRPRKRARSAASPSAAAARRQLGVPKKRSHDYSANHRLTDPTSGRFRKATSQGGADSGGLCRLASLAKRGELPGTTSGAGMTLGGRDMRNIDQKHAMIHMARQVRRLNPTP